MSNCNVCAIRADGDGLASEFCHLKIVRARKPHACTECGTEIAPGEEYERATGKWDGEVSRYRTCLVCVEIRTKFSCDGSWLFDGIWGDLEEFLFPRMTTGCLEGLSMTAKKRLLERWNKWRFDYEH